MEVMPRLRNALSVGSLAALAGALLFLSLASSSAGLAHILGLAWLPVRLASIVHGPLVLTSALTLLLVAWESGAMALSCAVFRWAHLRGLPEGIAWAFALALGELLYPKIIPATLSASLLGFPSLLAIMDLVGAAGPIVLIGLVNGAILSLGDALRHRQLSLALSPCVLALGVAASFYGYGQFRLYQVSNQIKAAGQVRTVIVQVKSSTDAKLNEAQKLLAEHVALSERGLRESGGDLVVWGETTISQPISGVTSEAFVRRRLGPRLNVPVVVGIVLSRGASLTNSVLLVPPLAAPACKACRYDKQLLVPIAEWIPEGRLGTWLRARM